MNASNLPEVHRATLSEEKEEKPNISNTETNISDEAELKAASKASSSSETFLSSKEANFSGDCQSQKHLDPLLQAREAIGEVHAILEQFGIKLPEDTDFTASAEPYREPTSAKSALDAVQKDLDRAIPYTRHLPPAKSEKHPRRRLFHAKRESSAARNLKNITKTKLKSKDWSLAPSIHVPKFHHHSRVRLLRRVSSVFKVHRSDSRFGKNHGANNVPTKLKSALKKPTDVNEQSKNRNEGISQQVRFGHVVVIDYFGDETYYELDDEDPSARKQAVQNIDVEIENGAVLSEHIQCMSSSPLYEGTPFTRSSDAPGLFVEAR